MCKLHVKGLGMQLIGNCGLGEEAQRILRPEVNCVRLRRPLPELVRRGLSGVLASGAAFGASQLDGRRPDPAPLLVGVPRGETRRYLERDIAAQAHRLAGLLDRRHVHARLSVIADDACRKLHADHVSIRLLCTYVGPGTEWVEDADVVRSNLCRIDVDVPTANRSVLRRPDAIRRCGAGDVLLLKGDAYRGNQGRGAVHRSPPIEGSGTARLVLKIDEHPCGC